MEGKKFYFNISGRLITDIKEIDSDEEWMKFQEKINLKIKR